MAISLSSAAMDFSVLRGPWPGDRQAGWRRGSHERKIGAGGTRLVYFIIGESCATRRISSQLLIDAYERLVPTTRRALDIAHTRPALRPAGTPQGRAGRGGHDA